MKELTKDLSKRARLAVNVDRIKPRWHGSGRDLSGNAAAGLLDERAKEFARVLQAQRWLLVQTDAAAAVWPSCLELADRKLSDRRLLLAGHDLIAPAHGTDGVEVHRKRRVQGIEGPATVLDAGNAQVGGIVARVEDDTGDGLLADSGDEL